MISRDAVGRQGNARRGLHAILPHAESRNLVTGHTVVLGFGRAGRAGNQIDAGAQQRRIAGAVIAPRPGPVGGAAIAVETHKLVICNYLVRTHQIETAVACAIDHIAGDDHVRRLEIRVGIIEHYAELRPRVFVVRLTADARVFAYLAVVKTVEIHALSVYVFETISDVDGFVHVAGGVERHRHRPAYDVDQVRRIPDAPAPVAAHGYVRGVSHLDGIARDIFDDVLLDNPVCIAGGVVKRMGPDAVAWHAADGALPHIEIAGAFFQKDSPGCVVASGRR